MAVINSSGPLSLLGVGFAHALVLFTFVNIGAEISGAHYNPAVTIPMICDRQLTLIKGIAYILSQFFGSLAAGGLLYYSYDRTLNETLNPEDVVNLGHPRLSPSHSIGAGLILEIMTTFFLVLGIFSMARKKIDE